MDRSHDYEEVRRDVRPRTVLEHVFCLYEDQYNGQESDFLFSGNWNEYRNCRLMLSGKKIAMAKRMTTPEIEEAIALLAKNDIVINKKDKKTLLLRDPGTGQQPVIMVVKFAMGLKDVKKIRDRVFFPDYSEDCNIKTDAEGKSKKRNGPYFAVFANWNSTSIRTPSGQDRQVAFCWIYRKEQVQLFGNKDLSFISDELVGWQS